MFVKVESYVGERGDRTPCRFHLDGRAVEVEEVLDQWLGDDYRYVKLRGKDGNLYILRLDQTGAEWELTLFQSPRGETMPVQPAAGKKRAKIP